MLTIIGLSVLIYMSAWFLLAMALKRRDVVDSAWGIGFVVVAWLAYGLRNNDSAFTLIAALLVTLWGARLFAHLVTRNSKKTEDYRYKQMGHLESAGVWIKTYINIFLLQGMLLTIVSAPVIAIMHAQVDPHVWLAVIGSIIWLGGAIFEAIADYQLRQFLASKKQGIMQSGLWHYSRHPNYFGEITTWWGAGLVALAFGQWWGLVGPVVITFLIVKVSGIPLLEKRYAKNPEFQRYAQRTSILIPLPVKTREKSK